MPEITQLKPGVDQHRKLTRGVSSTFSSPFVTLKNPFKHKKAEHQNDKKVADASQSRRKGKKAINQAFVLLLAADMIPKQGPFSRVRIEFLRTSYPGAGRAVAGARSPLPGFES